MSVLYSCKKEDDNKLVITKFDMIKMANANLQDFTLLRKRPKFVYGKEYIFSREKDAVNVSVIICIHKSMEDALKIANEYLESISSVMSEGAYNGSVVGNKFWWIESNSNSGILQGILFIRKNALFILSCDFNYKELLELAKTIDNGILEDADFVKMNSMLMLPVIDSITTTKESLNEGEMTKIAIYASDPDNEPLDFNVLGLGSYEPDPANVFTLYANRNYVGEPFFGVHTYQFVVINQNNVVSEISEFEIIINQ
jgi:hypothetical protein